jgi:hypothetical protein
MFPTEVIEISTFFESYKTQQNFENLLIRLGSVKRTHNGECAPTAAPSWRTKFPEKPPINDTFLCVFNFQFNFAAFPEMRMFPDMRSFSQNYRCYSVSMLPGNERNDVENGGKSSFSNSKISLCHS